MNPKEKAIKKLINKARTKDFDEALINSSITNNPILSECIDIALKEQAEELAIAYIKDLNEAKERERKKTAKEILNEVELCINNEEVMEMYATTFNEKEFRKLKQKWIGDKG